MKNTTLISRIKNAFQQRPEWALALGVILMGMSHLRFNLPLLAGVCMVPFLWFLQRSDVRRKWFKFGLALLAAWSLIVLKIISAPIPVFFVFLYSVPLTLIHFPGYWVWSRYGSTRNGFFLFAACMVILEWIQYSFTPLGSWGASAYMLSSEQAMIQSLSLVGMGGLSLLVYALNLAVYSLVSKRSNGLRFASGVGLVFVLLYAFGEIRMDYFQARGKEQIKVAAIDTDSEAGGLPLPEESRNRADFYKVLERSRTAAKAGAEIVVWTEAAFVMDPTYESVWMDSIRELSRYHELAIFAAHVKVVSMEPFRFENKYYLVDSGEVRGEYHKHEPVPGEPATKGMEPFEIHEGHGLQMAGAICYDYDFPYIARAYGQLHADLVAVPSSDWRGIDPLHTEMAVFRAVEQGHSVLRSTRFGLSAAIDPMGNMTARMSSFDQSDKIMLATLPRHGIWTPYRSTGDLLIYTCMAYFIWFFVRQMRMN